MSRRLPAVLALAALVGLPAAAADKLDGKKIFESNGCAACHAVSSAGITAKMKASKAPDLSSKAAKRDHEALSKYLRQTENLNGKKHPKAFGGSDEELGALIAWLQKTTPAK